MQHKQQGLGRQKEISNSRVLTYNCKQHKQASACLIETNFQVISNQKITRSPYLKAFNRCETLVCYLILNRFYVYYDLFEVIYRCFVVEFRELYKTWAFLKFTGCTTRLTCKVNRIFQEGNQDVFRMGNVQLKQGNKATRLG